MFTTIQKRNQFLMVLAVSLLAWCMSCFSFNPQMTGYRWGVSLAGYTGLQLLAAGWLCLEFWQKQSRWIWALVLCLLLTVPAVYLALAAYLAYRFHYGQNQLGDWFLYGIPRLLDCSGAVFFAAVGFLQLKQKCR